ncbi:TPA: hypothetical protein ROX91_002019 [Bacillus cereus]|nr:hypothetical protein [Bacillus cereus]
MDVDIYKPNKEHIGVGDLIVVKFKRSGKIFYYLVVIDEVSHSYRMLNLTSSSLFATFDSREISSCVKYIEENLNAKVLDIIPANKIKVGLK